MGKWWPRGNQAPRRKPNSELKAKNVTEIVEHGAWNVVVLKVTVSVMVSRLFFIEIEGKQLPAYCWYIGDAIWLQLFIFSLFIKYNTITNYILIIYMCWLIRRKARVRIPVQASKRNMKKKYFFGDFLSTDCWQKLWK